MEIHIFFQEFEYVTSDKVYLTYERMLLKLEEYTNIFKAHHPDIDFIFLFGQYSGNYKGI